MYHSCGLLDNQAMSKQAKQTKFPRRYLRGNPTKPICFRLSQDEQRDLSWASHANGQTASEFVRDAIAQRAAGVREFGSAGVTERREAVRNAETAAHDAKMAADAKMAERDAKMAADRAAGMSWQEVGEQYGITGSGACHALRRRERGAPLQSQRDNGRRAASA